MPWVWESVKYNYRLYILVLVHICLVVQDLASSQYLCPSLCDLDLWLHDLQTRNEVSVSKSRSRDNLETHVSERLGLVSDSSKFSKVSVTISSRTKNRRSRSRLGLGPQRLVYKLIFNDRSSLKTACCSRNLCEVGASRGTCLGWKGLFPDGRSGPKLFELTHKITLLKSSHQKIISTLILS